MRKLCIATGASRTALLWKNTTVTWEELTERLQTTCRTTETQGEYANMTKAQQDAIKDVGGFVGGRLKDGRRKADHVAHRDILTLDADFAEEDFCDKLDIFLSCAWCVYSTHKHRPEKPRLRLLIPLDRSVSAEEYEAISRKVAEEIGMEQFDDTTYQAHRLMYWPSTSMDAEYICKTAEEAFLCADTVLGKYRDWRDVTEWPTSGRTVKARERLLKKQEDPTTKNGTVGDFCRAYSVEEAMEAFLPGVYTPCAAEGRYTYAAGSTAAGAVVYDEGKFLYSNHATDPAGGVLCNAFDLVRLHKFRDLDEEAAPGTPTVRMPSCLKMSELAARDEKVCLLRHKEGMERTRRDFGGYFSEDAEEGGEDWALRLDVDAKGSYLPTIDNVKIILANDGALKGKFRRNEFTKKYRVFGETPWERESKERDWTDADDAGLRHYLEKAYRIKGKSVIEDAWTLIANENRYHPVRDYLNGLVWDGTPRLETLLIAYQGAEDSKYTRAVTKKSLVAAVARIFVPGIKYDQVLVLVGPQGCGKSSILKKLGQEWFSDSLTTVQGKEAYEQIQGFWIIEMAELSALKRHEVESVKQFTAKSEDAYRAAYGHHVETFKRQCVFFGTTNTYDFLKDMTGNRRFWPVDVDPERATKRLWTDLTKREIDQIWAEAVVLFRQEEKIHIDDAELDRMAREEQDRHLEESPLTGDVRAYLERLLPEDWDSMDLFTRRSFMQKDGFDMNIHATKRREKVCALEIWCELFGGEKKDLTRQKSKEINDIILKTGEWERTKSGMRFGELYGSQKGFIRKCKLCRDEKVYT